MSRSSSSNLFLHIAVIATVVPLWSSTSGGPVSVKHTTVGSRTRPCYTLPGCTITCVLTRWRLWSQRNTSKREGSFQGFFQGFFPNNAFGFPVGRFSAGSPTYLRITACILSEYLYIYCMLQFISVPLSFSDSEVRTPCYSCTYRTPGPPFFPSGSLVPGPYILWQSSLYSWPRHFCCTCFCCTLLSKLTISKYTPTVVA